MMPGLGCGRKKYIDFDRLLWHTLFGGGMETSVPPLNKLKFGNFLKLSPKNLIKLKNKAPPPTELGP